MKVGPELQKARLAQRWSLQDVAHATRIPVARLAALERDDLASFGSLTYARAFLGRYAKHVGVDVAPVLKELPGGMLGGAGDYRYLTQTFGPWVDPRQKLGRSRTGRRHAGAGKQRGVGSSALVMFGLLLVGTGLFAKHMIEDAERLMGEGSSTAAVAGVGEELAPQEQLLLRSEVATSEVPMAEVTIARAIMQEEQEVRHEPRGRALRPTEILED